LKESTLFSTREITFLFAKANELFIIAAFLGVWVSSYLVELLAKEGFLVVLVPYKVTFNHEDAMRDVYQRFNACLDVLLNSGLPDVKLAASQLVDLPVFSVGHRLVKCFMLLYFVGIDCYLQRQCISWNVSGILGSVPKTIGLSLSHM